MENQTTTTNSEPLPLPPPPPIGLFDLTPPPLTDHSYERYFLRKHMAFINGQQQFGSSKEQVQIQCKKHLQKSELGKVQSESIGQTSTRNLDLCTKCEKCNHWIQKTEMKTHLSCHAAKIIQGLLLGDKNCSMSKKQLIERNKVTHIVNAAAELNNYLEHEGIKYCNLDLQDVPGEDLIPQVTKAAIFIKSALDQGGVVFVHCALGKSRSVSAIIMYLMHHHKLNYEQSLTLIKQQRPIARPNFCYTNQLKEYYQNHLKAK